MVKIKKQYGNGEKRGRFYTGNFTPKHPEKYRGTLPIIYRSRWEKVFMSFCDINENVLYWASESVVIQYFDPVKNKMRRYFTDFFIEFKNGEKQLIEVKPLRETTAPKATQGKRKTTLLREEKTWQTNQAKWEAATHLCKKKGWKFLIITEKDLGL